MRSVEINGRLGERGVLVLTDEERTEFQKTISDMKADGFLSASISNTGLPDGRIRLTFLHKSAFNKPREETSWHTL